MLVCRKTENASAVELDGRDRRRSAGSRQGGPVFLPRRKLSALAEAVLRNHQNLPGMDDVAADPVGALER